mgnify:FL=1
MSRSTSSKARFSAKNIAYISLFSALIAICSWVSIPTIIPFTLQTFAVSLCIGLLGTRRALLSIGVYLLLGAAGVPVFSGFSGGLGILFGTTGGYLFGFLWMALVSGALIQRFGRGFFSLLFAFCLGLALCYAFGTAWYLFLYARNTGPIGLGTALMRCVVPFLLPDALKLSLAALATKRLWHHL